MFQPHAKENGAGVIPRRFRIVGGEEA